MALTMNKSLARAGVASRATVSRRAVVVRAQASEQTSRRALLGLIAAGVAAAGMALPQQAQAIKLPSQEFTGGLVTGGGSSPKSATRASSEGYNMEGTKKSGISAKRKAKLLAKAREEGVKSAS